MPRWPHRKEQDQPKDTFDHYDMSRWSAPHVEWQQRPEYKTFGDRLDFLTPEQAHLATGDATVLPARKRS